MNLITCFIKQKLKLKVNRGISAVDHRWKQKFLGFSFTVKETEGAKSKWITNLFLNNPYGSNE